MINTKTKLRKLVLALSLPLAMAGSASAQCETWNGNSKGELDKLTDLHSIYRGFVKAGDYNGAFEPWSQLYAKAPAADGKRDYHYTDGIAIYRDKYNKTTDDAKKEEYKNKIIELYDAAIECMNSGAVKMKTFTPAAYEAYQNGQKAYDLFYTFQIQNRPTFEASKKAIDGGGNKTLYSVITPLAESTIYMVSAEEITKKEGQAIYKQIQDVCNHNIANNKKYGDLYKQSLDYANARFETISSFLFDCDYFVAKLQPQYEAGKQEDFTFIEDAIRTLKRQGCESTEPFLAELEEKWAGYAAEVNAQRQAEFEANNPGVMAKKLYDSGDYQGAISKYQTAISEVAGDNDRAADYYYRIASIQFRKLKSYSDARSSARKAAELRPGWGAPYMLIGDMYASSSRNCGDSFMQRCAILAAINKYSEAKSTDPSVASDANERISKYSGSRPEKADAFMRGYKDGQTISVGCWIGESVTLRF